MKLGAPAVGVPEITPVELARLSPGGREPPDTDQARGAVPPVDASVVEYAAPTVVLGSELVVIKGAAATVIVKTFVAEAPTVSVALIVKLPAAAVGVPLITPPGLRVKPVGSEPVSSDQVGVPVPPEDARGAEYPAPADPESASGPPDGTP